MPKSSQPHGLQHNRLPYPSPSPGVCPSSCSLHQWCHPANSSSYNPLLLPSNFPSIRDFSNESAVRIRCPKYWSFIFSISLSNDYSGLTSLKIDWFDFLAVQGDLRSLLQHHSLRAVIHSLYGSALVTIRDHWEDIALTIQSFVSRIMSLLFNTLLGLS